MWIEAGPHLIQVEHIDHVTIYLNAQDKTLGGMDVHFQGGAFLTLSAQEAQPLYAHLQWLRRQALES